MSLKEYVAKKKEELKKYQEKKYADNMKAQADEIRRLKDQRIKEEGAARIRTIKQKELKRIEKAKAAGVSKPKPQAQGSGLMDFSFGSIGGSASGNMFDIAAAKSTAANNMFDMGFSSTKTAAPRKKARKTSKRKHGRR